MIKARKYLQNTIPDDIYTYTFRNSVRILKSLFAPHEEFAHTVCEYGSTKVK